LHPSFDAPLDTRNSSLQGWSIIREDHESFLYWRKRVGANGKSFSSATGNTRGKSLIGHASIIKKFQQSVEFPAAT